MSINIVSNLIVILSIIYTSKECEQCGEIEISNEVMQKLDKIIDTAKQLMQEVAVIDYKMTA